MQKTDVLRVLCFNNSIKEKFESLMLDEFPNDADISGNSITAKINRDDCFEKILR